MRQKLSTIRLNDHQSQVMTKIKAAATPELAYEEISKGRNLIAARDILLDLGLIEVDEHEKVASVTQDGDQLMKDKNLINDMGELTDHGSKFAYDDQEGNQEQRPSNQESEPDMDNDEDFDFGIGGAADEMDIEAGLTDTTPNAEKTAPPMKEHTFIRMLNILAEGDISFDKSELVSLVNIVKGKKSIQDYPALMEKLRTYYRDVMPYDVAKARTQEPDEWILEQLYKDFNESSGPFGF